MEPVNLDQILILHPLGQVTASVADVYLGSGSFSIPDPTKKEKGKNKLVVLPVLVDNYLIFFETGTKNDLSRLIQNLSKFNPKNCY
jgi:hypothetical protein